ncbi:hypothetical protein FNV43_RR14585 [Rhamnella rubrinervis]|uniref:Protein kinase domain-containing protein n=1 Tax=Rhamnella rubrinervis TaxID=2594499 RepID=A0A8K0MGG4_9ROSA|nr:hypothetical protein FNV43_RR14585 [Rhamnella rubrinervis]
MLLNKKWEAKVSDFRLSKVGPTTRSKVVLGIWTRYYRRQQLTEKSEVYAFGVVLCEVLCARSPIESSVEKRQMSLAEWAQNCYHNGTFAEIVDKHLRGTIAPECLRKTLQDSAEESKSLCGALNEMKCEDEVPFVNYMDVEDEGKFSCG